MKRFISVFLCAALALFLFAINVSASEREDILLSREIEVLENGDMFVREVYRDAVQSFSGISGHATSTYRTASGKDMWSIRVNGTFTYTYGVCSSATAASVVVIIHDSSCSLINKEARTSNNTATTAAVVKHDLVYTPGLISLSCDIYGNLY